MRVSPLDNTNEIGYVYYQIGEIWSSQSFECTRGSGQSPRFVASDPVTYSWNFK
jgi:hypothetical protein